MVKLIAGFTVTETGLDAGLTQPPEVHTAVYVVLLVGLTCMLDPERFPGLHVIVPLHPVAANVTDSPEQIAVDEPPSTVATGAGHN